jgi:hypothetical protein
MRTKIMLAFIPLSLFSRRSNLGSNCHPLCVLAHLLPLCWGGTHSASFESYLLIEAHVSRTSRTKDIQDAVTLLYSNNPVLGDLRTSKFMAVPDPAWAPDVAVYLSTFDWVGAHGIGRYPASLDNGLLDWESSGVQRCGIMDKVYDPLMLKEFKDQCGFSLVTVIFAVLRVVPHSCLVNDESISCCA